MREEEILAAHNSARTCGQLQQIFQFRARIDVDLELCQIRDASPPSAGSEAQFDGRVIKLVSQCFAGFFSQQCQDISRCESTRTSTSGTCPVLNIPGCLPANP